MRTASDKQVIRTVNPPWFNRIVHLIFQPVDFWVKFITEGTARAPAKKAEPALKHNDPVRTFFL
jgi:hypothetical protein